MYNYNDTKIGTNYRVFYYRQEHAAVVSSKERKIVSLTLIVFVILAALIVVLDWEDVQQIIGKAQWELGLLALLFTFISYFCLSYGYVLVNRLFSIGATRKKLFEVGFVSTTLNNILGFLGAAGHSLRVELIKQRGIDAGEVLAASVFHSYLNNVMLLGLLAVGLISLLSRSIVFGGSAIGLALIAAILVVTLIISTVIIIIPQVKSRLLRYINSIWHFFTHRDISKFLGDFNHALAHGLAALKNNPWKLAFLLGLMAGEWAFQAVALWFCFDSLGNTPLFGVLLFGFGIGLSAGNLSWIPGGLGVQEASMAGIYALLGMSFTQAVLVAILFRIVYDFIPFLTSLPFYAHVIRRT